MRPFLVPDDFRAFMQQVVRTLDAPRGPGEPAPFVDAEDALSDATGYGGRVDGADTYRFTYIATDGQHKWQVELREAQVRDIADGLLIEVPAERVDLRTAHREPKGHPLLIWGESGDDALVVRDRPELERALDTLRALAEAAPRMLRAWSAFEDQLVAVLWGDLAALYVIESLDGYATSRGDPARTGAFELEGHGGRPFAVPYHDCVPWARAREALLRFIERGELAAALRFEGRIPSGLLMLGDVDRAAVLESRAGAPRTLARTSLLRMLAHAAPGALGRTEPVEPADATGDATGDATDADDPSDTLDLPAPPGDELPTPAEGMAPADRR